MGADHDETTRRNGGREFGIGLCQYEFDADVASVDDLLRRAAALFERAGEADLYVLPELFVSDYLAPSGDGDDTGGDDGGGGDDGFATLDRDDRERLHGFLADVADERDAVVVGGSYNVADGGEAYNRCPVAVPGAGVETYDKSRPTPSEREDGKRAGEARPPVVEHRGVGVGIAVCYDVEFPELVRDLANRGAEVIAVPSWTATDAGFQRVRRCAAARAVENQAYVAQVSVVGEESEELTGTGRSAVFAPCDDVVGPHGTRLSLARDARAAGTCAVDIDALRKSREEAAVRPYADATDGKDGERGTKRRSSDGQKHNE